MTIYATVADFVTIFGETESVELSNLDDATEEIVNDPVVLQALDTASAEIDTYLRAAGYSLPLSEIPRALIGKCCDIARYKLDRVRTREEVRQRYLDAIFWLKDLSKGVANLGVTSASAAASEVAMPAYYTRERTFTFDSLHDY